LGIRQLTLYPLTGMHPKSGQELPQAGQSLSKEKVDAILEIDADKLVAGAKARRDQLVQQNPEFQTNMLEEDAIEVMGDAIKAVQAALRKLPQISLRDLVTFYERWFKKWASERVTVGGSS